MPGAGRESHCLMDPWRKAMRGLSFPKRNFSLLPSWIKRQTAWLKQQLETEREQDQDPRSCGAAGTALQVPFSSREKNFFSHLISQCQVLLNHSCLAALCFPCLFFLPICFQPSCSEILSSWVRDCLCCVFRVASTGGPSLAVIPAMHVLDSLNNEPNE